MSPIDDVTASRFPLENIRVYHPSLEVQGASLAELASYWFKLGELSAYWDMEGFAQNRIDRTRSSSSEIRKAVERRIARGEK